MPQRFQRSRRKGARLPAGVVVVTRPTKWGNPHPLELGRAEAVRRYREDLFAGRLPVAVDDVKRQLRGRDQLEERRRDRVLHVHAAEHRVDAGTAAVRLRSRLWDTDRAAQRVDAVMDVVDEETDRGHELVHPAATFHSLATSSSTSAWQGSSSGQ